MACQFDCRHKSHLPNHSNNIHTITIPLFVLFCFGLFLLSISFFALFPLLCFAWLGFCMACLRQWSAIAAFKPLFGAAGRTGDVHSQWKKAQ